jgi:hypothetical protein
MAYPRRCPLCGADYREAIRRRTPGGIVPEFRHTTLRAKSGGTPSPREPALPGRLLTLRCLACGGAYAWDFFAGRTMGADALDVLR